MASPKVIQHFCILSGYNIPNNFICHGVLKLSCFQENIMDKIFNDFYVNVAKDICKDFSFDPQNHPSLNKIRDHGLDIKQFDFKFTDKKKHQILSVNLMLKRLQDVTKCLSSF